MADRVGQQLGNYRLLRLLGQGGQASVYLGEHIYLKSQAAVKVRHVALTEEEQSVFLQEAQTLVRLSHPHIVRVLDFALQDGLPFLVMEYAAQGTLRHRHPRGTRLPLEVILPYIKQVASALQYTHDQRLIHRDVKPENLLFNSHDQVLLSDFGLVTLMLQSLSLEGTEPMEQSLVGTTPYLAPEQLRGKARPSSDQYALGIVVYEWLCGKPPFHGPFLEVAVQHVSTPPPSLREQLPDLSPAIEEVVLRALAKEPEQRFASVQEFATALEHASQKAVSPLLTPVLALKHPVEAEQRRPEHIFQLTRPDLPSDFPALKSLTHQVHNLPVQPTPFLGREQEVAAICDFLRHREIHLVTLIGPGGIGKTRLSLQVAAEMTDQFADGVFFVALAPVSDAEQVVPTIMQTLSIKEAGEQPLLTQLKEALKDKQVLLLLDNFEQVIEAAVQVAGVLTACPKLKILVTSRIVLHVQAEREFAVPPLSLPNPKHLPDLVTLSQYEAVALFIQRTQAVKPDFTVTNANAPAVAAICARLDGLPLAIELAAARVKFFAPQALLTRLEQGLAVLSGGARDLPARQQTLRGAIAWSYDLLSPQEQALFRRLSVFVDGWTIEAAEEVCQAVGELEVDMLDGLLSLVDKSLLRQEESEQGEPRFWMLQLLREFGLEALAAKGELQAVQEAHARSYLRLVVEAQQQLADKEEGRWLDLLEREYGNLRSALSWMLEGMITERVEMAIQLCEVLSNFWLARGQLSEGVTFLERIVAGGKDLEAAPRAKALLTAATMAEGQGDFHRQEEHAHASLALYRELGDHAGSAQALRHLAWVAATRGDGATARQLKEEAVALLRKTSDKTQLAGMLFGLADELCAHGEYARGLALFEECMGLNRELGNKTGLADALMQSAWWIYNSQGDLATARMRLAEALPLVREVGDKFNIATHCWVSALAALGERDLARAHALAEESIERFKELERPWYLAWSLIVLAKVEARQSNAVAAGNHFEESLKLAREISDEWLLPWALEGLAGAVTTRGETAQAARLWSAAETLRENSSFLMPPVERNDYEQAVASARAQLGEDAFAAAWQEGRTMPLDKVIDDLLKTEGKV